jgi:cytochrome c556
MNKNRIKNQILMAVTILLISHVQLLAAPPPETVESLVLRKIMRDMGENMQLITDGISREDWKQVEENAALVANHPQPPVAEKVRIMAFAGENVVQFKGRDKASHDAALTVAEAAARKDSHAVIADFANLQEKCLMCHQQFRESFQKHFYGERRTVNDKQ